MENDRLVTVSEYSILMHLATQYCTDMDIEIRPGNKTDLRFAIRAFASHVQNVLMDECECDVEDFEVVNGCKNCKYSYSDENYDLFCMDHEWMAVDGDDMCSDWEEGEEE